MAKYRDAAQALRARKLRMWGLRQVISAVLFGLVVMKWPNWWWIIPIWLVTAGLSLWVILRLTRRLEQRLEGLDDALAAQQQDPTPPDSKPKE